MSKLKEFLYRNRETLEKLGNDMEFSVWINNSQGDILWVNEAARKLYGVEPQEVIGRNAIALADEGLCSRQAMVDSLRTKEVSRAASLSRNGTRIEVAAYPLVGRGDRIRLNIGIGRLHDSALANTQAAGAQDREAAMAQADEQFVMASPKMKLIMESVPRLAQSDATVMISGETGVGKDELALQIHKRSRRSKEPFVVINCATLPENLLESELFGYEKGAFTNAASSKKGLLEIANNGTVFLDEVGDIPLGAQVKLLRCIQNQQIMRVGGTRMINLNVRFITATHQDVEQLVQQGKFREDLYYRLNVVKLEIPPLRERFADILPLVKHFLTLFNCRYRTEKHLSKSVLRKLQGYSWPGNVRQLKNTIEHLVVMSPHTIIGSEFLPSYIKEATSEGEETFPTLQEALERKEEELLRAVIRKHPATRQAARILGCDQSTVVRKLHKYGIV